MNKVGNVGVVVVGLGAMGSAGLDAFLEVAESPEYAGRVSLRALVDLGMVYVDQETGKIVDSERSSGAVRPTEVRPVTEFVTESVVARGFDEPATFTTLEDALLGLPRRDDEMVLVYDASPTVYHESQLDLSLAEENTAYIGEKPLFTEPGSLTAMGKRLDEPWWCEFVETESLAVLTLQNHLAATGEQIQELNFWRYSSMGVKKILQPLDRNGVQGGTVLDKSIHDLSVAHALLGGLGATTIVHAEAKQFMPSHILSLFKGTEFLGARDSPVTTIGSGQHSSQGEGTADSVFELEIDCALPDNSKVAVRVNTSWIGLPQRKDDPILLTLEELVAASDGEPWHRSVSQKPTWGRPSTDRVRFEDEELRLVMVRTDKSEYAINLLNKPLGGSAHDERIVEMRVMRRDHEGSDWEAIPLIDAPFGKNALARVFAAVCKEILSGDPARHLNGSAACAVHDVMLRAQASGIDGYAVAFGESEQLPRFKGAEDQLMEKTRTTFAERIHFG